MTDSVSSPERVYSPPRLAALAALGLKNPGQDPVLQELANEAARRLNLPTGLVTIVLDTAQVFAASHGLTGWMTEAGGIPVEWSFCANSVRTGEPLVIEDATTHPLVRDNPLVLHEGIRCYAGIPLVTRDGEVLGNLCVVGTEARTFDQEDLHVLRDLARRAVERIESRTA